MLLKLEGLNEKPFPLLFLPLYVIPSVTYQVFTFTVPTSNFFPIGFITYDRLSAVKIEAVVPNIDEFIF